MFLFDVPGVFAFKEVELDGGLRGEVSDHYSGFLVAVTGAIEFG